MHATESGEEPLDTAYDRETIERLTLRAAADAARVEAQGAQNVAREFYSVGDGAIVSALRRGVGPPQFAFLHGAGQNAHTWDVVAMLLGCPSISLDLPGHGHSSWRQDQDYRPVTNATALLDVLRQLDARRLTVVGMSLGGMTAVSMAADDRDGVIDRVMVLDIVPSNQSARHKLVSSDRGALAIMDGPLTFASRDEMLALATGASGRSREELILGVSNNSRRNDDGSWSWRYDIEGLRRKPPATEMVWEQWSALKIPTMLVKGGSSAFVDAHQLLELSRRVPCAEVRVIENAGHSVHRHRPRELVALVRGFACFPRDAGVLSTALED